MRLKILATTAVVAIVSGLLLSGTIAGRPASATSASTAASAASYATQHGYRTGIAVLDTQTGAYTGAGSPESTFASESVMKVFIATRLLLTGQMNGWNATTAYKMITQSDDASANALYGRVGGDTLITWIKQVYGLPSLGSQPPRAGWWGGTQITAHGLALFYNKVRHDARVWPWLGNAMAHATTYGSDGTYQFFGIPSATSNAAIKQGWGADDPAGQPAVNSTGFVNGDRYVVVILTQGGTYGTPIANMLTSEARLLMPGGRIVNDSPNGALDSVTVSLKSAVVRGWVFDVDAPGQSLRVHVYVNGRAALAGTADGVRADVDRVYGVPGAHGYSLTVPLVDGVNSVCAYGINVGAGANVLLGCRSVVIAASPQGALDSVTVSLKSAVVRGWVFDVDAPGQSLRVHVYVNGRAALAGTADGVRADVDRVYGVPGAHGYSLTVPLVDGVNSVCAYGINVGAGANVLLGCRSVVIAASPQGALDSVTVSLKSAVVRGWVFDVDAPGQSLRVHVYVNGRAALAGTADGVRADVDRVYGVPGAHGYSLTVPLVDGVNSVCAYGINVGAGANVLLGCRTVQAA